jgi:hypothetical protein
MKHEKYEKKTKINFKKDNFSRYVLWREKPCSGVETSDRIILK